jgi:hypothetical protein
MKSISELYDSLLEKLFLAACGVLFLMMLMICADVFCGTFRWQDL